MASDIQRAWQPGGTVSLQWIVVPASATSDNRPHPVTITAELEGPYASVNMLKAGTAAARTIPAPVLNPDDRDPASPTSTFTLPSDLAPGLYNLAFRVDYGGGNSVGGASVVQVGAVTGGLDPMATLGQRPLNLPVLTSATSCPESPPAALGNTAPDSGFGAGPVYLSGQPSWYSGGQVAVLMVDPRYTGPLLVRAAALGGSSARITLAGLPQGELGGISAKESQHSVTVVTAVQTPEGDLQLQADPGPPSWRAWFGRLSTNGGGCFGLQVDGADFSEVIVVTVHAGAAIPG